MTAMRRIRNRIARRLHLLASRIQPRWVDEPVYTSDPKVDAIKDQTRAVRQVADRLQEQTAEQSAAAEDARFDADRARLQAMEGAVMPSEGLPLRIESDGVGMSTRLMIGDMAVSNALRVTWAVSGCGVARALVEFDAVEAHVSGEIAGS